MSLFYKLNDFILIKCYKYKVYVYTSVLSGQGTLFLTPLVLLAGQRIQMTYSRLIGENEILIHEHGKFT